jgi:hypothetical protein
MINYIHTTVIFIRIYLFSQIVYNDIFKDARTDYMLLYIHYKNSQSINRVIDIIIKNIPAMGYFF